MKELHPCSPNHAVLARPASETRAALGMVGVGQGSQGLGVSSQLVHDPGWQQCRLCEVEFLE